MKRLVDPIFTLFNLRALVAALALWWAAGLPQPQWLLAVTSGFDHTVFRLAMDISALPSSQTQITVVHVPAVEYDSWLADIPGAERLESLLSLSAVSPDMGGQSVVGIVLERPLIMIQPQAESLLGDVQKGRRTKDHLYNEVNQVLNRRERLIDQLQGPQVILGVEGGTFTGGVVVTQNAVTHWASELPKWAQRFLWHQELLTSKIQGANPVFHYAPIWEQKGLPRALISHAAGQILPGFELLFLHASQLQAASSLASPLQSSAITWQADQGVVIGSKKYPASVFGEMIPLYGEHSNLRSALRQISLDAALASDDLSGWILVGRDGSKTLEILAQSIAAMADGAQIVEPMWWSPVQKGLLILLALWVCFVVPRLTQYWRSTTLLMIGSALALTTVLAQSIYQVWLPVGQLVLYLLLGVLLISLWQRQVRKMGTMTHTLQLTLLELADYRMANGEFRLAMETLGRCENSSEVYGRLYHIGETLTEQNQVDLALDAFTAIRKRRYKDVSQKMLALDRQKQSQSLVASQSAAANTTLDQTQALQGVKAPSNTLGRYHIKAELGRGAHGTVYLGYDPSIDREVAIKTLNYEQYDRSALEGIKGRFFKEARAVGRLSHPHIVQVYDMGEEHNLAYMTMDYAKGHPLSDYINPEALLDVATVYRIVLHVAEALHYAHQQDIVHRDIKPSNIIFLEEPFSVRVTDFGIARVADHSQTRTGEILGSPLYMAPEQLRGETVGCPADIFSLGVTFYQLLTGVLPFNGDNIANLSYAVINEKHQSVRRVRSGLPSSATRITNMALQKKPEHRYLTAFDFSEAVRKALKRDFGVDVSKERLV